MLNLNNDSAGKKRSGKGEITLLVNSKVNRRVVIQNTATGSVYTDSRVVYYEEDSMGSSLKVGWMDEYTLRIYDENDTIRTIDLR